MSLDTATTRRLLGECPRRSTPVCRTSCSSPSAGVDGVSGYRSHADRHRCRGHGRDEEIAGDEVDLARTVGWFTTKYPVALTPGVISWEQVRAGDAALGAVIKDAKEQLRALPDGLTYGLLRYLNPTSSSAVPIRASVQLPRPPRCGRG